MLRSFVARAASCLATVCALQTWSPEARAYDAEVEATTTAQNYQLNGRGGDPVLSRRRLTQTMGLAVYNFTGDDSSPTAPQLFFRARMRLDADFGESREEASLKANPEGTRFVAGLPPPLPVDLMYGYLEGKRYLHGLLGFRVGRQYLVDPLGYYAFDGALLRLTTPAYLAIELYGGFEVRAGLPLSNGRWELGGVQRGSREGFSTNNYPSFQQSHVAPLYGVAIESAGPTWIHGRLTYRKVFNTGQTFVGGPSNGVTFGVGRTLGLAVWDGRRVSTERIGYGMTADLGSLASLRGSISYDLYSQRVNAAELGTDVFLGEKVIVGLDYSYWRPVFDADSIFNVFNLDPIDDVSARIEVNPTPQVSLEGDAMVRRYRADDAEDTLRVATSYAPGGGVRARYSWPKARGTIRVQALTGDEGDRYGSDLYYERSLVDRWLVDGRLSLWHFSDKLRADVDGRTRTTTSFGYTLGTGYRITAGTNAFLQFEQDINRLLGQRFRVMAVFNARVWL